MNQRGTILIAALCAVAVFSILAASSALHMSGEVALMKKEVRAFQNRSLFVSGLSEAVRSIQNDPMPHEDSVDEPWFGHIESPELVADKSIVHVSDEESKLNLNQVPGTFLTEFFREFEDGVGRLKGDPKDYVKAILKRRYQGRLESLEELLILEDFAPEDLDPLRPFLTVYPDLPLVNPNTAHRIVRRALIGSIAADHAAKYLLASRLEEACGDKGCDLTQADMSPEAFAERFKLPRTGPVMQAIQAFLALLTLDSQTFRIAVKTESGGIASGVFKSREGQVRPQVVQWHENF